jgi:hypothetical protein
MDILVAFGPNLVQIRYFIWYMNEEISPTLSALPQNPHYLRGSSVISLV